jgi:hypothetical protein
MGGFLLLMYWQGEEGALTPTIVGSWSNVIQCRSANQRIDT